MWQFCCSQRPPGHIMSGMRQRRYLVRNQTHIVDSQTPCALCVRQVSGLMGVAMCMYAGVGTQLFSFVKRGTSGGITRQVNFGSFGNTFLVLFQIMTSESVIRIRACCAEAITCSYLDRVLHLSA